MTGNLGPLLISLTVDGGVKWTQVDDKVGTPGPRCVDTIEASRFADGRAYVAFDAHRSDDDKPYAFVTEDFGETWKSLTANLPQFGGNCANNMANGVRRDSDPTIWVIVNDKLYVFAGAPGADRFRREGETAALKAVANWRTLRNTPSQ